jgi:hypothetical protein
MTVHNNFSRLTRRDWLRVTLQLSFGGAAMVLATSCQKRQVLVCSDPTRLSDSENSLRTSLHYSEQAPEPDKACARCAFFNSAENGCGICSLLKGPVNPHGHCDSWSQLNK